MEFLSIYNCKFVYVKGQDNTMADALSRYLFSHTSSDTSAEMNAHHSHTDFDKKNIFILNHSSLTPTSLMSIAALTQVNPQRTKLESLLTTKLYQNFVLATSPTLGAKNSYPHPEKCQILLLKMASGFWVNVSSSHPTVASMSKSFDLHMTPLAILDFTKLTTLFATPTSGPT